MADDVTPGRADRVEALCLEALSKDGAARAAFLQQACGEDAGLRAEVESLLAGRSAEGSFLETPAWAPGATPLTPGTTLGPYRIVSLIGTGGMGEVYAARDMRLDRTVAIKVLPPALAADPARRARFEREAKAISALNHPHICTVHDIGREAPSDDRAEGGGRRAAAPLDFLVMEHLEGQTLAARLEKGPVPLDQALSIGAEIADALAAAHRQGVTHRDLKPANVMLTRVGGGARPGSPQVKLLDFGLAKLKGHGERPAVSALSEPRATLTAEGTIVGTLQYMAPEQLEGKPADARTDIWALGAILYEMLTGQRPFQGTSAASLVAAILEHEPAPLPALVPLTPPALDRVVRTCLEKDPDARWQSAGDVARELRWIADDQGVGGSEVVAAPGRRARRRARWATPLALVAALSAGAVAGALFWRRAPPPLQPPVGRSMRMTITLPADKPLAPAGLVSPGQDRPALALSHDGTRLAYVGVLGSRTQICLRDMQTGEVTPVEQTSGGHTPFFSPDDEWLGFFADNKLKKLPLRGGSAVALADAPYPWGATWGTDGQIYFNRYEGEGLFRVNSAGGPVEVVVSTGRMPTFVGAGPGLLFASSSHYDELQYVDLATRSISREAMRAERRAQHLSSGIVIHSRRGTLGASRFDPSQGFIGRRVTLSEMVRYAPFAVEQFAASESGTVVWVEGRPQGLTSFVWVDRNGRAAPAGLPEGLYGPYALSPDGTRVCYGLDGELHVWDWARRVSERLTPRSADSSQISQYPLWTPDGTAVVYQSSRGGRDPRLMAAGVDRSAPPVTLGITTHLAYPMGFSPDGSTLSFFSRTGSSNGLRLMPVERSRPLAARGEPTSFLETEFGECFGRISPDGRWMLFSSDSSGAYEIWATTYPKAGPTYKLSDDGGREAMFNPARRHEVVYLNGRTMYAVDVSRGPDKAGRPVFLFEGAYPDISGFGYDMAPDGRFLMLHNPDILKPTTTLHVITNVGALLDAAK